MNRGRLLGFVLCVLCLLCIGEPPVFSQEALLEQTLPEYVVDVSENRFILGKYEFLLEDVPTPISVGVIDGNVLIGIQTADGPVELSLGEGVISLTERAVSYVTVFEDAVERSALLLDEYEQCPVCGRSLGIGNHRRLKCGHYGCLVSLDHLKVCSSCGNYACNGVDHSRCEHCKVRMCVHISIECEYMRNPAPTPFSTMVPGEGAKYFLISEDGTKADGALGISPQTTPWSPGEDFIKTPKPSPSEGDDQVSPEGQEGFDFDCVP